MFERTPRTSLVAPLLLAALFGACRSNADDPRADDASAVEVPAADASPAPEVSQVEDDVEAALERARSEGKGLFVSFVGFNCVNCRMMDAKVLATREVREELAPDFVELRLHVDGGPAAEHNREVQRSWIGNSAIPSYAVVDPGSGEVLGVLQGLAPASDLVAFLRDPGNL